MSEAQPAPLDGAPKQLVRQVLATMARSSDALPVATVLSAALALVWPASFAWFTPAMYAPGLGFLMFAVGVNLRLECFHEVFRRPQDILVGTLGQWVVKPLLGLLLAVTVVPLLGLPHAVGTGLILAACVSGAQLSSYATYLLHKEQAPLAIVLTALSTAAGVVITPALALLLLGKRLPIDVACMSRSITQVVIVPVAAGLACNRFAPGVVQGAQPLLAAASLVDTCACVGASLASNITTARSPDGALTLLPVALLHTAAFAVGHRLASATSGLLALLLASRYFKDPLVCLPAGLSTIFMTLAGFGLVVYWSAAEKTGGGARASPAKREEISELVEQLNALGPRAPVRSPLFPGAYEVLYCSNPNAPGGPVLRSPLGQLLAAGQELTQTLSADGSFRNQVNFRTLGLIPGSASQDGEWTALDGRRYQVALEDGGREVQRTFEVLYLDERLRVAKFQPEDGCEPQLFVFRRSGDAVDDEEEEAEEEDKEDEADEPEAAPAPKRGPLGFLGRKAQQVQEDEEEEEKAPAPAPALKRRPFSRGSAAAATPTAQPVEDARAAEVEAREAVRRQLQALTAEFQAAQAATRRASQAVKELERSAAAAKRAAGPANALLERLGAESEATESQAGQARDAAAAARQQLQEATAAQREVENRTRQTKR
ncbi:hypothetical protein WJX81_008474 [Elliptochloris bilobata]|uniref:Uncharacterized protein n=1 Tax=Elliptochloris bilobata TaxID=381761 RepID=A0AAW1RBR8_9CHLO